MERNNRIRSRVLCGLWLLLLVGGCSPRGEQPAEGIRVQRVYWPGGKLRTEVTFRDSVRHGPARSYYRSGGLRLAMEWEQGLRVGQAVTYYEDGAVYQVTPFAEGTRQGIQRRYYPGGELMAEMPYRGGQLVEGLREYARDGRLLTPEAHIVFALVERPPQWHLVMALSDGCPRVTFHRYVDDSLRGDTYPLITHQGRATLEFRPRPATPLTQKVLVRAQRQSPLGNTEIFHGEYLVRIGGPRE